MWISKIELTNFKSYQRQILSFPEPNAERNIVVIGGLNGYGKTTILEALYLCLYGKDAMVHLARAGLKTDDKRGYPTFLERAFNGEALREGKDTMMVRVTINRTKTRGIDIARKWFFRANGMWTTEEEAIVRDVVRAIPETPRVDGRSGFHLPDLLEEHFVPAHIAPFFFFDGEEVKKLADQSRIEQVKQGLEGLLGVVLLRALGDRLKNFESSKRSEVMTVDEENLASLLASLTSEEAELHVLKEDARKSEHRRLTLRAQQDSLVERITAAGGAGGDIATVKELVEEREQFRQKFRENQKRLEEVLAGRLPFHLVPKGLMEAFRKQLMAEIRLAHWENEKKTLEPKKAQFETAFFDTEAPAVSPALTEEQVRAIRARIEAAWSSLFYPPPEDCASEVVHDHLSEGLRQDALSFLDNIGLGQKEIQDLCREQDDLQHRVDDLGRKISRVEGIDRDGTLAALKKALADTQKEIDELAERIRADDRRVTTLDAMVISRRAEYEREKKKLDESSPMRALIAKSEKVRTIIDEVIPELFPLKVRELARAMTDVYRSLAHKQQVDRIEILDDGTTRILSKSGKEIQFDRSAGENQIFATSLIAALAKVSGVKAPLVVDTPLGRLDSKHRANILTFWTRERERQVILLSQDKEIDEGLFSSIEDHVCKTYLLEHADVGDGIGRTTAVEDRYFAKVRQ